MVVSMRDLSSSSKQIYLCELQGSSSSMTFRVLKHPIGVSGNHVENIIGKRIRSPMKMFPHALKTFVYSLWESVLSIPDNIKMIKSLLNHFKSRPLHTFNKVVEKIIELYMTIIEYLVRTAKQSYISNEDVFISSW